MELQRLMAFMKKSEAVYQKYCNEIIKKWDLNATSFGVLMFLANNPEHNTARDVCRMGGIKTGIASISVDHLIRAGYIRRETDPEDRRIQRLFVEDKAGEVIRQGRESQTEFLKTVTGALTPEERAVYFRLTDKIMDQINEMEQEM